VLPLNRLSDHVEAECRLHIEREPEFSGCARTLGDFFLRRNDRVRAKRMLELYLRHPEPGDTEASRAYMQLQ
jgi:hypothetical protein